MQYLRTIEPSTTNESRTFIEAIEIPDTNLTIEVEITYEALITERGDRVGDVDVQSAKLLAVKFFSGDAPNFSEYFESERKTSRGSFLPSVVVPVACLPTEVAEVIEQDTLTEELAKAAAEAEENTITTRRESFGW